ncbi:hypothetical protein EV426DRAFT_581915 [Tirmania nivea]|nr:hypothetical protein EV426DRAFT_581915 [Tirmania nivea]
MSILTPTIAVTIIWALFVILTITIAFRFYAIRIHNRRKEQLLARHPSRTSPSPSPQNGIVTSKTVLTAIIIALHNLTLLYCVAVTLAVIWGYDLADKRRALIIQYGGADNDVANMLVGGGEVGKFRRYLQKLGLAMELAYVVTIWILKCGLVAVGWQVGKALGLWGSRSMTEAETDASEGNDASTGRERLMDAETKSRISIAKATLNTLGCGTIITFLGVISYKCIVIGMALSRSGVQDITSRGLRKEVVEAQNSTIVAAVGSLGTYLHINLAIVLTIILLSISRSPHQPHPQPRPPIFLYGGIFMLSLIILTTAASSARTGSILMNTTSIRPRIGDLIMGGILFGNATDSTYGKVLGLNEKVFAVLEMVLGGTALCVPGMRVLFDSTRARHGLPSSGLVSTREQPFPASARESTSRPPETRGETVSVFDDVLQRQRMSYHNADPYTAVAARIASFYQGSEGETIGARAVTGKDRGRSRSRSRSREGTSSTGRNHGHVAPGAQLPQQGYDQQRQNHQQWERDRGRTEGMDKVEDRLEEDGPKMQGSSGTSVAPIPPLSIPRQQRQLRGTLEKALPPLPLAAGELARDRELRRIGAGGY